MRFIILILIIFIGYVGYQQHQHNEQTVKESVLEMFEKNGYQNIKIDGINLPLTFTFLGQKVETDVFFSKDSRNGNVKVDLTPIETYPIMSIFGGGKFYTQIPSSEMMNLIRFK
tara:strand:- start:1562 stop:1903 length:342 start_codon:yes stop_codon:yes gene_type:complete